MLIEESYAVPGTPPSAGTTSFGVEIAPAPPGMRLPLIVVVHGNFGLQPPYGDALREFTEEIAQQGFVAALPTYYPPGTSDLSDTSVNPKVPILTAAIEHLSKRPDVDPSRLGLVGFSLGGGVSLASIQAQPPGAVRALVDFYGYVGTVLGVGVAKCPPTIVFHNKRDLVVRCVDHSEPLLDALSKAGVAHEPTRGASGEYPWYDESNPEVGNHPFLRGHRPDTESRQRAIAWLRAHV